MTIITTTRPLSNADRKAIWKNKLSSPPERTSERVSAWPIIRDTFGAVLVLAVCAAFVGLLGMQGGVW